MEVQNGLYDTKRGRRAVGRDTSQGKLLLCRWRIHGAVKMAGVWLIPKTAEKPIDGRTKQGKELHHE